MKAHRGKKAQEKVRTPERTVSRDFDLFLLWLALHIQHLDISTRSLRARKSINECCQRHKPLTQVTRKVLKRVVHTSNCNRYRLHVVADYCTRGQCHKQPVCGLSKIFGPSASHRKGQTYNMRRAEVKLSVKNSQKKVLRPPSVLLMLYFGLILDFFFVLFPINSPVPVSVHFFNQSPSSYVELHGSGLFKDCMQACFH